MPMPDFRWPAGIDRYTLCFTVDVDWAAAEVIADLRELFDQYGVQATFFVTHAGVDTLGHERGLHPNFRRNGDTYRQLLEERNGSLTLSDYEVNLYVLQTTLAFAPEAKGLRTHSLYYDATLLPIFKQLGLEYDCSPQRRKASYYPRDPRNRLHIDALDSDPGESLVGKWRKLL